MGDIPSQHGRYFFYHVFKAFLAYKLLHKTHTTVNSGSFVAQMGSLPAWRYRRIALVAAVTSAEATSYSGIVKIPNMQARKI